MTDEIYLRACVGPEGLYTAGDIDTAIPWPDVLKHAPTEALIDALLARGGVDEILRAEQGDERTRVWTLSGPAILVGIRLPMTHKRAEKTEGAE